MMRSLILFFLFTFCFSQIQSKGKDLDFKHISFFCYYPGDIARRVNHFIVDSNNIINPGVLPSCSSRIILSQKEKNDLFSDMNKAKSGGEYDEYFHGIVFYDEKLSIVGSISISLAENRILQMPKNLVPNVDIDVFKQILKKYGLPDTKEQGFYKDLYELGPNRQLIMDNEDNEDDIELRVVPSEKLSMHDKVPKKLKKYYSKDISYGYSTENPIILGIKKNESALAKVEEYCKNHLSASYLGNPLGYQVQELKKDMFLCKSCWDFINLKIWIIVKSADEVEILPQTPVGFMGPPR